MPFKAHFYVTIMPTVNDNYVFTYFIYFTWAIKMQNYSYFYFNFSAGIDNFLNIINDPSIHLIIHLVICQKKKEKKKLLRQSNTSNLWTLVISEIIVLKKKPDRFQIFTKFILFSNRDTDIEKNRVD